MSFSRSLLGLSRSNFALMFFCFVFLFCCFFLGLIEHCRYELASADTIIWTNFDLVLAPDFYVRVAEKLHPNKKDAVGFSVLRLDVMIDKIENPSLADWTVADVYKVTNVKSQGGHDCMVFPRRWIPCLQTRDMVFGVGGKCFNFSTDRCMWTFFILFYFIVFLYC
jgi:hypothetical protein